MAKLNGPVLSLGAHGSIGDSLTFVRRSGGTVAEKKPRLPYSLTLAQQYQRWLYQDYAYLWTKQPAATQSVYRALASVHHNTPIGEWLKYCLAFLPDIVAWWKLDEPLGAIANDTAKTLSHGIIYGPIPTQAQIDLGRYFDNLDDYIEAPGANLDLSTKDFTLMVWVTTTKTVGNQIILKKRVGAAWYTFYIIPSGRPKLELSGVDNNTATPVTNIADGLPHRLVITRNYTLNQSHIYVDGVLVPSVVAGTMQVNVSNAATLVIGRYADGLEPLSGTIDDLRIYNRVLDATQVAMDALRRYP